MTILDWFKLETPRLDLGVITPRSPFPQHLVLGPDYVRSHKHLLGLTGRGKSRQMVSMALQLFDQGEAFTLIDPDGEGATLVLQMLTARGYFDTLGAFDKILYFRFSDRSGEDRAHPYNILAPSHLSPHATAAAFKEACHRAWPSLSNGNAPSFDTLSQMSVKVLASANLPVTYLQRFLVDREFHDKLVISETDPATKSYFIQYLGKLNPHDRNVEMGSTLRRANLLSFNPALSSSFGATDSVIDIARFQDERISVLFDLSGVHDREAKKLLGCWLTVAYEEAAKSRLVGNRPMTAHHLFIDEMGDFVAQSEEALSSILSSCRKVNLFAVLAHQTWTQASERLRGAIQNCAVEIVYGIGREDAEHFSKVITRVDADLIKHEVDDPQARERFQPAFHTVQEQFEESINSLVDQAPREAVVRLSPWGRHRHTRTIRIRTNTVQPPDTLDPNQVERVKSIYWSRLTRPIERPEPELAVTPRVTRRSPA